MTRKLIEVALPLEAISAASRRDKDRKTGTIKNVHKWFAPMPTPAWRALLFASIVDDPGTDAERQELLDLITELVGVDGELPTPTVLERARRIMATAGPLPTVLDPFCGGGSTIVEAQRLGMTAVGSDLNPVPVLITTVLGELLPAIAGRAPLVGGELLNGLGGPLDGFFSDLRHYAEQVRARVWERVSELYPSPSGGGTVVAWLWARTADCPNPACGATIPLYGSPWLSKRRGNERWLKRGVRGTSVLFEIGVGSNGVTSATKSARGAKFSCPVCGTVTKDDLVREQGRMGKMGHQLMAAAVDRDGARDFVGGVDLAAPSPVASPSLLDIDTPTYTRDFKLPNYGLRQWSDLFTPRQLLMLSEFATEVAATGDVLAADGADEDYRRAITGVLGLCVGKLAMANSTQSRWKIDSRNGSAKAEAAFGRQALPMVWDYAEPNPFGGSAGDWLGQVDAAIGGLGRAAESGPEATVVQRDARAAGDLVAEGSALVATDPPYFAQIGYADLSDYFYLWHRLALAAEFPELYGTMTVPKEGELVAMPHRHVDAGAAYDYYVDGFTETFRNLAAAQRPDLPMVVIYAHRQEESDGEDGLTSSAWDALLEAMLRAGVGVVGTWPIHATSSSRQIGQGTNALASYVVLVCRPRVVNAGITDRPGFVRALRDELPPAMAALQAASTLPFDLTQAAIGPGMAIFSRFARVVEPAGEAMRVRTAIGLINQVRSEILSEQDDEFDAETRWAIQWFERYAFDVGPFGEAEKLFTATATSLDGLRRTGIVGTKAPNVWLLDPESLPTDWDPVSDLKTCTWEVTMHLIRALHFGGGEQQAATLLGRVGRFGDLAHDLAYRVADVCEQTKRANTALLVNGLIASWPEISRLAASGASSAESQGRMF